MTNFLIALGLSLLIPSVLLLTLFPVIQVCGDSMLPTLEDGRYCVGRRVFKKTKCKVGEVYVYKPPYDSSICVVKRLAHIEDGKYYFLGDNPSNSHDSRSYGYVNSKAVIAHIPLKPKE